MHRFRKKPDAKASSTYLQASQPGPSVPVNSPSHPTSFANATSLPITHTMDALPSLPPDSDFRTSLILPELSRRFSLLKQHSGGPVGIEDIRREFANRRAKGAQNVITEEEEDFAVGYLQAYMEGNSGGSHPQFVVVDDRSLTQRSSAAPSGISDFRDSKSTTSFADTSPSNSRFGDGSTAYNMQIDYRMPGGVNSVQARRPSGSSASPSMPFYQQTVPPSPSKSTMSSTGSFHSKRYSNNLFGSGQLKDQGYIRQIKKSGRYRGSEGNDPAHQGGKVYRAESNGNEDERAQQVSVLNDDTIGQAILPSENSEYEDELEEDAEPDVGWDTQTADVNGLTASSATSPMLVPRISQTGLQSLGTRLTFAQVHRASLALEEVIRNFEQDAEAEEQILTPRTPSVGLGSGFGGGSIGGTGRNGNKGALVAAPLTGASVASQMPHKEHDVETSSVHLWREKDNLRDPRELKDQAKTRGHSSPPLRQHHQLSSLLSNPSPTLSAGTNGISRSPSPPLQPNAASPTRMDSRIPGYIPGMHRPITPRDTSTEDSSTPRATSPHTSIPVSLQLGQISSRAASLRSPALLNHRRGSNSSVGVVLGSTSGSGSHESSPGSRARTQGSSTPTRNYPLSGGIADSLSQQDGSIIIDDDILVDAQKTNSTISSSTAFPPSTSSSSSTTSSISPSPSMQAISATAESHSFIASQGGSSAQARGLPSPASILKSSTVSSTSIPAERRKLGTSISSLQYRPSGGDGPPRTQIGFHSSGSRPDTPLANMYTGSQSPKSNTPNSTIGRRDAASLTRTVSSHSRSQSQSSQQQTFTYQPQDAHQRNESSSKGEYMLLSSPALPDSPLIEGQGGSYYQGAGGGINRITADDSYILNLYSGNSPWGSAEPRPSSNMSFVDLASPTNPAAGSVVRSPSRARSPVVTARSPTPGGATRSGTPGGRSPTPSAGRATTPHYQSLHNSTSSYHHHTESTSTNSSGVLVEQELASISPSTLPPNTSSSPTSKPSGMTRAFASRPFVVQTASSSTSSSIGGGFKPASSIVSTTNPLVLSPFFNSSRSSLVSAGSSYHSADDEDSNSISFDMDSSSREREKERERSQALDEEATMSDHEDLLNLWVGISKPDMAAIHSRLVDYGVEKRLAAAASVAVANSPGVGRPTSPFVTRSPSQLRKRRPSTSLSIRSVNKDSDVLPSPSAPLPAPTSPGVVKDNASKANALLKSVLDSLPAEPLTSPSIVYSSADSTYPESSPENLASFPQLGQDKDDHEKPPTVSPVPTSPPSTPSATDPATRKKALAEAIFGNSSNSPSPTDPPTSVPAEVRDVPEPQKDLTLEDLQLTNPPPIAPSPSPPTDQLVADVSRKNEEATKALKSSSAARGSDNGGLTRKITKRIDPQQISTPQPLALNASVDALPLARNLASPSAVSLSSSYVMAEKHVSQASKLSQRIKRLKGSLRGKPSLPAGEESHAPTHDPIGSAPAVQAPPPATVKAESVPARATASKVQDAGSTSDLGQYRFPPAASTNTPTPTPGSAAAGTTLSATPPPALSVAPSPPPAPHAPAGLKGLMSRLRKSKRDTEPPPPRPVIEPKQPAPASTTPTPAPSVPPSTPQPQPSAPPPSQPPSIQPRAQSPLTTPPISTHSTNPALHGSPVPDNEPSTSNFSSLRFNLATPPPNEPDEEAAVKQLFDAASSLGLDREKLNELVRSTSSASRTANITRSASVRTQTPTFTPIREGPPSNGPVLSGDALRRALSSGRTTGPPVNALRARETIGSGAVAPGVVIRRTLIYPSEGESLGTSLSGKHSISTKASRRQSSQSNKSLHDRVPTPPPNRAIKRLSRDRGQTPPLPSVPPPLSTPSHPVGRPSLSEGVSNTSSTYGSLYDLYGDPDSTGSEPSSPISANMPGNDSGQAVEIIELSNGEVIWSVVDGLRNDAGAEGDDAYQPRASMTSDFSSGRPSREEPSRDGMQVLFKEHRRLSSRGSGTSQNSRRRVLQSNAGRPETKVFFSSPAHIGRLIDSMSRGAEGGSFTIVPNAGTSSTAKPNIIGHSPAVSMSDNSIPVEDRLDHLLRMTATPYRPSL